MTQHEPHFDCGREPANGFPVTQWTLIFKAIESGQNDQVSALNSLCRTYWFPLYAFARRRGYSPEEAEDLTQEYFSRLIAKGTLGNVDPERGKFRCFLLMTFKYFLANEWEKAHAQKRGNGVPLLSIHEEAESRYGGEPAESSTPETLFERHWALALVQRVFARLEQEYVRADKREQFQILCGCLPGAQNASEQTGAAANMPVKNGALRMAALRLRRRYGELLRAEVATTITRPEEIDEELQHLMSALAA